MNRSYDRRLHPAAGVQSSRPVCLPGQSKSVTSLFLRLAKLRQGIGNPLRCSCFGQACVLAWVTSTVIGSSLVAVHQLPCQCYLAMMQCSLNAREALIGLSKWRPQASRSTRICHGIHRISAVGLRHPQTRMIVIVLSCIVVWCR